MGTLTAVQARNALKAMTRSLITAADLMHVFRFAGPVASSRRARGSAITSNLARTAYVVKPLMGPIFATRESLAARYLEVFEELTKS